MGCRLASFSVYTLKNNPLANRARSFPASHTGMTSTVALRFLLASPRVLFRPRSFSNLRACRTDFESVWTKACWHQLFVLFIISASTLSRIVWAEYSSWQTGGLTSLIQVDYRNSCTPLLHNSSCRYTSTCLDPCFSRTKFHCFTRYYSHLEDV